MIIFTYFSINICRDYIKISKSEIFLEILSLSGTRIGMAHTPARKWTEVKKSIFQVGRIEQA